MSVVKGTHGGHRQRGRADTRDARAPRKCTNRSTRLLGRVADGGDDIETLFSSQVPATDISFVNVPGEIERFEELLRQNPSADKLVEQLRPELWIVVKQAILERELRNLAITDDLTCLYNRRGFFAAATHHLKMSFRGMRSSLLLICNVENLQEVARSFGDREAELMLVRTADVLEQAFRDSDILARLSTDQFAVLASGTSAKCEQLMTERLKVALSSCNETEPRYRISISVGKARFDPHHPSDLSQLIAEAGRAIPRGRRAQVRRAQIRDIRDVDV